MRATDNGRPAQSTDATVVIRVVRIGLPIISQPFENTIREDIAEGVSVITVNASHPLGVSQITTLQCVKMKSCTVHGEIFVSAKFCEI